MSAYLDGFEPVEPTLTARDAALMGRIEGAMGEFRAAIDRGASPNELAEKVSVLDGLFDDAEAKLREWRVVDHDIFRATLRAQHEDAARANSVCGV